MLLNFLLPKEIKEIFKCLDRTPLLLRSVCSDLKTNNNEISDFCSSYNVPCAESHYENLFLDFDQNLEVRFSLLNRIAKKSIARDKKLVVKGLKDENQSPQEYSTLLIISLCEHFLGSGRQHIYRGVLSPEGHTFALIHYLLLSYSEKNNFLTSQQRKEITEHTKGLIKDVG